MKPMEAWSIISANLAHLVRIRRSQGDPKGFVDAETEAEVIAFRAMKEMQERMYPEPLSIKELQEMAGEPIWVESDGFESWAIVELDEAGQWKDMPFANGLTADGFKFSWDIKRRNLRCYRSRPAEVNDNA